MLAEALTSGDGATALTDKWDTGGPVLSGPNGLVRLSRRQVEMLELAAHGLGSKQIATYLGLSRRTVEEYFGDMRERTGTKTRGELLVRAVGAGLVQPEPDMFPGGRGTEPSPSRPPGRPHGQWQPIPPRQGVDDETPRTRDAAVTSPPKDTNGARRHELPGLAHGDGTAGQALGRVPASDQADSLSAHDALGVLRQLHGERGQLDRAERALIDIARRHGVTWTEIGQALGLRSAQAAQQRRKRLD